MKTDASFRRRPQVHLPVSAGFDFCNDVFLDLYNDAETDFVFGWYTGRGELERLNVGKPDGVTGRYSTPEGVGPGPEAGRRGPRAPASGTGTGRRRSPRRRRSHGS